MSFLVLVKVQKSVHLKPIDILVDEFLIYCHNSRAMSPATIKTRKTHLNQFARYCAERAIIDVSNFSPVFIDDYFSYYQSSHTVNTTNTSRRIMKVFLKWISGYKEIPTINPNTIHLVRVPKSLPRALSVDRVLEVIDGCKYLQDGLIINLLLESGIRISELVAIRVEDILFDTIIIHGKGSIERTVYISDKLARKIEHFCEKRFSYEYLFQNIYKSYGQKMTVGTVRLRIQKEFKKHGIEMYPHRLRHTFAVTLLKNGCDIVTISRLLGHADIKTTMIYLNVSDDYLRERHKSYMIFT